MVALLATGGSTNHLIHWVAVARSAGIFIDWTDFDDLSAAVPLLARVYPNGDADVNQFQAAGGPPGDPPNGPGLVDRLAPRKAPPQGEVGQGRGPLQEQVGQLVAADDDAAGRLPAGGRKVGLGPGAIVAAKVQATGQPGAGGQHTVHEAQRLQDGHALGHDALATGLVPRKGGPVDEEHPEALPAQEEGGARPGNPAAHDDHVGIPPSPSRSRHGSHFFPAPPGVATAPAATAR